MEKTTLPAARSTIVDGRGLPTPTFYRFLQSLTRIQDGTASDDDLQALQDEITRIALALGSPDGSVEHIPPGQNQAPTLQVSYPLVMSGLLQNGFALVEWDTGVLDDSDNVTLTYTPGSKIVADLTDITDSGVGALLAVTVDAKGRVTGTRDATITGTAGRVTVAHGDASDGVPTIDLDEVPNAGGGSLLKIVRDLWGRITGTSTPDTDDLAEGATNLYYTDARADARIVHAKGQPDGIASLVSGKLDPGQLPALAITETFVVNTQAAMLALDCEQGDVAVRTDLSKSFILTAEPASTLTNWQELLTPVGGVTSFNGRTGSVTPASGDYTFSQIANTPTTLSGYGITDAAGLGVNTYSGYQVVDQGADGAMRLISSGGISYLQAAKNLSTQSYSGRIRITGYNATPLTGLEVRDAGGYQTIWHTGNFDPASKLNADSDIALNSKNIIMNGAVGTTDAVLYMQKAGKRRFSCYANSNAETGGNTGSNLTISRYDDAGNYIGAAVSIERATGNIYPGADNSMSLGTSLSRWSVVYAATGTINTSDAREKTPVEPLTGAELAAAKEMSREIGTYRWLSSIGQKGSENARHHAGLTVQRAIEIMQTQGLDPFRYGFICHDEWEAAPAVIDDETGDEIEPPRAAGDRYSFRHDELLLFLARGFAARLDALEAP